MQKSEGLREELDGEAEGDCVTGSSSVSVGGNTSKMSATFGALVGVPSTGGLNPNTSGANSHNTAPLHIASMLKVILLHDKFTKYFLKWSLLKKKDKDILVLTLKNGAILDSTLIFTICMMYPFRINGPFLAKNTMNIEFLHETTDSVVNITPDIEQKNLEFALTRNYNKLKRKRTEDVPDSKAPTLGTQLSADGLDSKESVERSADLTEMRAKLSNAILSSNNTRIFVENVQSGLDATGSWASFQLSECEKINLDFFGCFQLAIDDMGVKVRVFPPCPASSICVCVCFLTANAIHLKTGCDDETWEDPQRRRAFLRATCPPHHFFMAIRPCLLSEHASVFHRHAHNPPLRRSLCLRSVHTKI